MKIQIDTENKTIKVEEKVNLKELFVAVKKLFPNDSWKEYSLDSTPIINWYNPIIIEKYIPDLYPWYKPYVTYSSSNVTIDNTKKHSTYCVEIN